MKREDDPSKPDAPPARRNKPTIKLLMLMILIISLALAYVAAVERENRRIGKIHGELLACLNRIGKTDPSLIFDGSSTSHTTVTWGLVIMRTRFQGKARYTTPTGHPIAIEININPPGQENRLVLSSGDRAVTRPIQDLENLKIDLKAEFPEAFR